MYSRYAGYQPFDPMQNRLSQSREESPMPEQREEGHAPIDHSTALPVLPMVAEHTPAPNLGGTDLAGLSALLSGLSGGGGGGLGSLGGLSSLLGGKKGVGSLLSKGGKGLGGLLDGGIGGLLRNFSLNWDSGDILLALILLFMSMESDDDEILLLLGLMLFMG